MAASHQDAAGWGTNRGPGVVPEESDPLACQSVDVGSFDFLLAVAAQFAPPKIVSEDENNIGSGAGSLGGRDLCMQEGQRTECKNF